MEERHGFAILLMIIILNSLRDDQDHEQEHEHEKASTDLSLTLFGQTLGEFFLQLIDPLAFDR